jgi:hypothetical protein
VYVKRRTLGEIDYVFVLVYCVLREERNLDVAAIAEGGENTVRMGSTEGFLKIVERFLAVIAAYLLERHNVWVQPLDHIGKQLEFALVRCLSSSPASGSGRKRFSTFQVIALKLVIGSPSVCSVRLVYVEAARMRAGGDEFPMNLG